MELSCEFPFRHIEGELYIMYTGSGEIRVRPVSDPEDCEELPGMVKVNQALLNQSHHLLRQIIRILAREPEKQHYNCRFL